VQISEIDQEAPKIEFPCAYPIKVMGFASTVFQVEVLAIIHRHASPVPTKQITERASTKGNYISVTVIIEATGEDQLKKIFDELMQQENVKLVL
jgi:putative lipoic acid-binding regulatory protein